MLILLLHDLDRLHDRPLAVPAGAADSEEADTDVAGVSSQPVGAGPQLALVYFDNRVVAVNEDPDGHAVGGVAGAGRVGLGRLGAAALSCLAAVEEDLLAVALERPDQFV